MDEAVDFVPADESRTSTGPMLLKPSAQVVCHADIERSVPATGENVDVVRVAHGPPQNRRLVVVRPGFRQDDKRIERIKNTLASL